MSAAGRFDGMRDTAAGMRLARFRAGHPEVTVGDLGFGGTWQARIPQQPNGEQVVTRHRLWELLDVLDVLLAPP